MLKVRSALGFTSFTTYLHSSDAEEYPVPHKTGFMLINLSFTVCLCGTKTEQSSIVQADNDHVIYVLHVSDIAHLFDDTFCAPLFHF